MHPYHIDTLLQLSEVCRMSEDPQMAAELIGKYLVVMTRQETSIVNGCVEDSNFYIACYALLLFHNQNEPSMPMSQASILCSM